MRFIVFALWPVLMACLLAGCGTEPGINWNERVGKYTYDQSVQDLGTPDKSSKQSDGTVVAEWLRRSYSPATVGTGGGDYMAEPDWSSRQIVAVYPGGPESGQWLRLTFGPDGKLESYKHFRQ